MSSIVPSNNNNNGNKYESLSNDFNENSAEDEIKKDEVLVPNNGILKRSDYQQRARLGTMRFGKRDASNPLGTMRFGKRFYQNADQQQLYDNNNVAMLNHAYLYRLINNNVANISPFANNDHFIRYNNNNNNNKRNSPLGTMRFGKKRATGSAVGPLGTMRFGKKR
ncbi:unnamed protein product [Anisakis simplex]|uniref:Uncharacterized protein n=1 Tax=Anisakis simplex TaxID=6269 RepID=A0A0M3JYT1_ANISI|nr:unnamed protein product [Anisakis simplex]